MERESFAISRPFFQIHRPRLPVVSEYSDSSDSDSSDDENEETNVRLNKRLLKAITRFEGCEEIEQAIEDGADVNLKDENGDFPLIKIYAPFHTYKIIEELIRHNVDVNAQNKEGTTALQHYLQTWSTPRMDRVALLLLKAGADMNIKDNHGNSAWHVLAENGSEYCGKVKEGDYDVFHALGHEDKSRNAMFLEILKYQKDINARDGNGRTALHIAVRQEDIELVRMLTKHRADPNAKDHKGSKPLPEAIGNPKITTELLDAGAEVEFSNPSEISRLHVRLLESDLEFLPLFIKQHTVNSSGVFNRTILHLAASLGCNQHIKRLLAIPGIDVNAKDVFGQTCLHFATQIGKTDIIEDILKAGADTELLNDSGQSICHLAAIYGHYSLIELFIHKGLSLNTVDGQGRNCLHYAVMYRHPQVVNRLLNANVDAELKDCKGKRPGDYLLEGEDGVISKMLRWEIPDIHVLSADVDPPYDQASRDVPHLAELPNKPGIGPVTKLDDFDMSSFVALIKGKVEELMKEAIPELPEMKIVGCGSSFEGSKVVIPDEMDFVLELFTAGRILRARGYNVSDGIRRSEVDIEMKYDMITDNMSYPVWLWDKLMMWWGRHQEAAKSQPGESVPQLQMSLPPQRHPDRPSCITWTWLYNDGSSRDFPVSINFVPAARDGKRNVYIVPETPRKLYDPDEGKYRKRCGAPYPLFEVHVHVKTLKALDERLLNVFIAAKCLREPEVCGFKIKKECGDLVPVKEFVTSFLLKTVFMHLTPVFQNSDMSHGKMVLMVYESLGRGLEKGNIPSFCPESENVLIGSRLDPELSLLAARKMTKFARFLYERDFPEEKRNDALQEQNVMLRIKVDIMVAGGTVDAKFPFYMQPPIDRHPAIPDGSTNSVQIKLPPHGGFRVIQEDGCF